jgi:hypothetical protein
MKPVCCLRMALAALAVATIASSLVVGTSAATLPPSGVALLSQTSDIGMAEPGEARAQARHAEPVHTTVLAEVSASRHGGRAWNSPLDWAIGIGLLVVLWVVGRRYRRR